MPIIIQKFKSTDFVSKINNTQVDYAKDLHVIIQI